jgi:YHS domain-containing protein
MKYYLLIIAVVATINVFAQGGEEADRRRNFNTENYVAMREWDPVSYFQNKPARGSNKFQYKHKAIIYYFASEANMEEFKKSPGKYEPEYGGWCAYTISQTGERVKVSPTTYKIVDGKLYLFYNFGNDNRMLKWNKDEKKNRTAADKNWLRKMH